MQNLIEEDQYTELSSLHTSGGHCGKPKQPIIKYEMEDGKTTKVKTRV